MKKLSGEGVGGGRGKKTGHNHQGGREKGCGPVDENLGECPNLRPRTGGNRKGKNGGPVKGVGRRRRRCSILAQEGKNSFSTQKRTPR